MNIISTKLQNIDSEYNLSKADLENILSIYIDKNNNLVFNLNETLYVKTFGDLEIMITDHPIHWSTLSYKLYETTRFAWLLMKINQIPASEIFKKIQANFPVYYLSKDDIITILNQINE